MDACKAKVTVMKKTGLNELRQRFLKFFEDRGHLVMPGYPLVPRDDPSILLINAGMTPLKPFFTGERKPPAKRIATCQKCIRTPDIERVGLTARHGTFFEMLGNFSFGDYFKKETITWAWEFLTRELDIPAEKLWVSVYGEDDEAFKIWEETEGLLPGRIVSMGKEENFWEHGTGPCGPCSEIHYDRGADKGCGRPDCAVGCDCDRYIEVWNLVFTQFYRDESGEYSKLDKRNIDTGMGLERLAAVMQGAGSLFEVDTIRNILLDVCARTGTEYGKKTSDDTSIRVITDHIRSTVFMVTDGIVPSNEGRGYVLRRLLRRAARHGRLLGVDEPFLYNVASVAIGESKGAYPELAENSGYIMNVIRAEEERFEATIDQGSGILEQYISEVKQKGGNILPGEYAFRLHDTFGFPYDLTREIAAEHGLSVDEEEFKKMMEHQRQTAREALSKKGSAWSADTLEGLDPEISTSFVGYETLCCDSKLLYIVEEGSAVDMVTEGQRAELITGQTPFYAESGGQVGDSGIIKSSNGVFRVETCTKTPDGKYLHAGITECGYIKTGDRVHLEVDSSTRLNTARNHTATHILQKALKNVLGDHVKQAGSLVSSDRLRFDFTHNMAMKHKELKEVENEVNRQILSSIPVATEEMSLEDAKKMGATALFGEKYGDRVRVVSVGDYSMELCGGTHLKVSSGAGLFKIVSESGIASGVRRIEALTGEAALEYYQDIERKLGKVAEVMKTTPSETLNKAEQVMTELKNSKREMEKLKARLIGDSLDEILAGADEIYGFAVVAARLDDMDMQSLRKTGDRLKEKLGSGVIVLASAADGKVSLVAMATSDAVDRGVNAGDIVRDAARAAGGGGGGRPDMAQAGGKDITKIEKALETARKTVVRQLEQE